MTRACSRGAACVEPGAEVRRHNTVCRACENADKRARRAAARAADQAHQTEPDPARLTECLQWATSFEKELVAALAQHGSLVAAAEALGVTAQRARAHLQELERRAARQGHTPGSVGDPAPPGFLVKGTSTLYGADGSVKLQWTKTKIEEEHRLEVLAAAFEKVGDAVRGLAEPVPAPAVRDEDLLCVYPWGDPHLGMHAWAAEAGENFDLDIAVRQLYAGVDSLVSQAPPAAQALLLVLGDFFHADGNGATTTKGTRVDVDTRHPKVYEAGLNVVRRAIDRLLQKHASVTVGVQIGNHDENASIMMAIGLAALYEREPRVTIDKLPAMFHRMRFGVNLIGWTHGHTVKHVELAEVMACDWPEDWGATLYRQWYVGHVHHDSVKERRGCTIETVRTLAAKDAYHASHGYRAGRDMKLDVWHREYGKIGRSIVSVQQLRGGR